MLGDSTAAGYGVYRDRDTPAAHARHRPVRPSPTARWTSPTSPSWAPSRPTWSGQVEQLARQPDPDVAVIMIGANDVTHRSRRRSPCATSRHAVRRAAARWAPRSWSAPARTSARSRRSPQPLRWLPGGCRASWPRRRRSRWCEAGGRTVSLGDLLGPSSPTRGAVLRRPVPPVGGRLRRGRGRRAALVSGRARRCAPAAAAAGPFPAAARAGRAGRGAGGRPARYRGRRRDRSGAARPPAAGWPGCAGGCRAATGSVASRRRPAITAERGHSRRDSHTVRTGLSGTIEATAPLSRRSPPCPKPSSSPPPARPIGRAVKGSLIDSGPDDLAAQIVRAALDKVPELDPRDDRRPDARLRPARRRAGLQHGPRGRGAARLRLPARHDGQPVLLVVAADHPDGVPRDQGRRGRRVHLGRRRDASPGSPRAAPTAGRTPTTRSSPTAEAAHRDGPPSRRGRAGTTRARTACSPTSTSRWARPPRTWPSCTDVSREEHGRVRRPLAEPGREGDRQRLLGSARSPRSRCRTAPWSAATTGRGPGVTLEAVSAAQAGVPPGRHGHRRQLLPAQRRRRRGGHHERHQGRRARPHAAGPDRRHRRVRRCRPEIMGLGPVEASRQALARAGHDHRRHRPGRDQRGVRRPGDPVLPRPRASTSTG